VQRRKYAYQHIYRYFSIPSSSRSRIIDHFVIRLLQVSVLQVTLITYSFTQYWP